MRSILNGGFLPLLLLAALCAPAARGAVITVPGDHPTIQAALDAAAGGDTILVAPGLYRENIDFLGKAVTLRSTGGARATVIDGGQAGSVATFASGEGRGSVLAGFTITNGLGNGGGINCIGSSPTIARNIIADNFADHHLCGGGGIACRLASPLIEGNEIVRNENRAGWSDGGGIECTAFSSPAIRGNLIAWNSAGDGGGITCTDYSSPVIEGNRIEGNVARSERGGAIRLNDHCTVVISNNMIVGNSAGYGGGISCNESCDVTLANNTISGNSAYGIGGLQIFEHCTVRVANTIFWKNDNNYGTEIYLGDHSPPFSSLEIAHSVVEGGTKSVDVQPGCILHWGSGMSDSDPYFVDPGAGDYHIPWNSPCREGGDSSATIGSLDHEGDPRVALGAADIGADEFFTHLYHVGAVRPGAPIELRVVGPPSPPSPVILALGSSLAEKPFATRHGDIFIRWPPVWLQTIGTIPATGVAEGVLSLALPAPAGWVAGEEHPFQALVGPWGGSMTRITNAMVLTVE